MGALSPVLRSLEGGRLAFWCSGCDSAHTIQVGDGPGPRWVWTGGADKPTFKPSVLVRYDGADAGRDGAPPAVCHTFITDGQIHFLGDCTHALAGQTVDLPPKWDEGAPTC